MGIFRVEKTKNYTVMSNYHLKNKEMSLKAKGLLSIMLSLPNDWDYSIAGLESIVKESKGTVAATLKELEQYNHLERKPIRVNGKIVDWEYIIYEEPLTKKPELAFQEQENQEQEKPELENWSQLNTKELNTNISNTKELTTKNKGKKESNRASFDTIIDNYTDNEDLRFELKNHLAVRKAKKGAMTNRAIEISLETLDKLTHYVPISEQEEAKIKIVQQSIERGWIGFFEVKENKQPQQCKRSGNPFFDLLREEGKIL